MAARAGPIRRARRRGQRVVADSQASSPDRRISPPARQAACRTPGPCRMHHPPACRSVPRLSGRAGLRWRPTGVPRPGRPPAPPVPRQDRRPQRKTRPSPVRIRARAPSRPARSAPSARSASMACVSELALSGRRMVSVHRPDWMSVVIMFVTKTSFFVLKHHAMEEFHRPLPLTCGSPGSISVA